MPFSLFVLLISFCWCASASDLERERAYGITCGLMRAPVMKINALYDSALEKLKNSVFPVPFFATLYFSCSDTHANTPERKDLVTTEFLRESAQRVLGNKRLSPNYETYCYINEFLGKEVDLSETKKVALGIVLKECEEQQGVSEETLMHKLLGTDRVRSMCDLYDEKTKCSKSCISVLDATPQEGLFLLWKNKDSVGGGLVFDFSSSCVKNTYLKNATFTIVTCSSYTWGESAFSNPEEKPCFLKVVFQNYCINSYPSASCGAWYAACVKTSTQRKPCEPEEFILFPNV